MKKLLVIIFVLSLGCAASAQIHYMIKGNISEEFEGYKVRLMLIEHNNELVDSTIVVGGKFSFEGDIIQPCWASVIIDEINGVFVVLEDGTINMSVDGKKAQCLGTPTNNLFQKYWEEQQLMNETLQIAYGEIDNLDVDIAKKNKLRKELREATDHKLRSFVREVTFENLDNIIPAFWIRVFQEYFSSGELYEMLAEASPVLKSNTFVSNILNTLQGNRIVDALLETPDGKQVKFTEYCGNGHITLVNVWASWCGACIVELPIIRAIYKKYSSKGLEILSITMDRDKTDWKEALLRFDFPWSQLWADYSFFNKYGINRIPVLMLISSEGIILKRNFKADELDDILNEYLTI